MRVITNFSSPQGAGESSLAIGCFDGLHRAHRAVLDLAVRDCAPGLIPSVFTFSMGDGGFKGAPQLETDRQRLAELARLGVKQVFLAQPEQVRDLTPEEFVERILVGVCRARRVCCGFHFQFGKNRAGSAEDLRRLCAARGIETAVLPEMTEGGSAISSTRIRALVQDGQMEQAGALLGRPFGFLLPVASGRQLGRTIGVPTMNQPLPPGLVRPRFGAYASQVVLDGAVYYGLTNVGKKPTVGSDQVVSETWIPRFQGDLYGREVEVSLLHFLRPEQKFPGLSALREQIGRDQLAAEHWLRGQALPSMKNLPPAAFSSE